MVGAKMFSEAMTGLLNLLLLLMKSPRISLSVPNASKVFYTYSPV